MKYSKPLSVTRDKLMESLPDRDTEGRALAARVGQLSDAVAGLERLAEHRDPAHTPESHYRKVAAAAAKLAGKFDAVEQSIHDLAREGSSRLDREITERANLRPNEYAAEVRASVRAMKPAERRDVLNKAVDAGDAQLVAALVDAPSVVTGIDPQYGQRMKQAFVSKHAADEAAEQSRLHETYSTSIQSLSVARAAVREATNPEKVREIEERAAAAQRAQSEFDESLSG